MGNLELTTKKIDASIINSYIREDFYSDSSDIIKGIIAIKHKNSKMHILYKVPPKVVAICFFPRTNEIHKLLDSGLMKEKYRYKFLYYSQECYLEFIFNENLSIYQIGIKFPSNVPIVRSNIWIEDIGDCIFTDNRCYTSSLFSDMDIAEEITKNGLDTAMENIAYKFISSNMSFIYEDYMIDFSVNHFHLKYSEIFSRTSYKLNKKLNVSENIGWYIFYMMLEFTHQNVKQGNFDLLTDAHKFYPEFAEWVVKLIE